MNRESFDHIRAIALWTVALFLIIGMLSYSPSDIYLETSDVNPRISNYGGIAGAYLAWVIFRLIGFGAWCLPILIILWGLRIFQGRKNPENLFIKCAGTAVFFIALSSLLSMPVDKSVLKVDQGGLIGFVTSTTLVRYCGIVGSYIVLVSCLILSSILATESLLISFISNIIGLFVKRPEIKPKISPKPNIVIKDEKPRINIINKRPVKQILTPSVTAALPLAKPAEVIRTGNYKLPYLDLLDSPPPVSQRRLKDDIEANSKILEETLQDFGIEAKVMQVEKGPIVTVYEVQPAPGVKINRITALSDDIALVMKAASVRIVAPIPGKSRVGIEVPNTTSTIVFLREILESKEFKESQSRLTLALGKDVSGNSLVGDLCDFPHLLIAGTTGSGKTVCVNSLIMSLMFNATPDEVKLLMVDPKMVELAAFNGIPHLLCPVVTEPKKAASALRWVVSEMENRYKIFAKAGARNIELYNEKSADKMSYIVVIIDELADLMLVVARDIEDTIARLAQLSRAVGIHIVLATQRPSVDVVTGVIKANFPARISFQVASKVDSRTVLDMNGADKLLGKGDMLFLKPGEAKPIRAQGSLVGDIEIEKVVKFITSQRQASYDEEILKVQEKGASPLDTEKDELYDEAKRMVLETGIASVSMLQRRLRLGYTRAARLIDMMEEEGIVGPYRGSKPREILIDRVASRE